MYARITRPYPGAIIFYLSDLKTLGVEDFPVQSAEEMRSMLQQHPEVTAVMFTGNWMPRRAVPIAKVDDKLLRKQFRYTRG